MKFYTKVEHKSTIHIYVHTRINALVYLCQNLSVIQQITSPQGREYLSLYPNINVKCISNL